MEGIQGFFSQFSGRFSQVVGNLTNIQKMMLVGAVLALIIGMLSVFALYETDENQYLFVDLGQDDITDVANFLKNAGTTNYVIDNRGIKVPKDQVIQLRLKLSQAGLPAKGIVGWEKFDDEDFTRTEFEQNIQKLRAIQGELSRTIQAIDGIQNARVHIVMPKSSIFVRKEKKASAAIYIKTKRGIDLDKKQIKGIQHLVSRSVEGLENNDVTIINSEGRMLSEVEASDFASKMTKELLAYKNQIEKNFENRIRSMVGRVVGPDRIEARVDAEVDFTQEKQTISDVDPEDAGVLAKSVTGFKMDGQGLNPTGIPGAKSNVPGEEEAVATAGSSAKSTRETELINYDISKTVSEKTMPVGTIKRLTVSVLVDGQQPYPIDGKTQPKFEARSQEEMQQIEALVKNAIGYTEKRDSITVQNMLFQLDPYKRQEIQKKEQQDRRYLSTMLISVVVALALVLFFMFIVRPYFRWLTYDPERKNNERSIEEYKPDLDLGSTQNVQIQEDVPFDKLSPQEQITQLAKTEPKRTTEALRLLLNPHQNTMG